LFCSFLGWSTRRQAACLKTASGEGWCWSGGLLRESEGPPLALGAIEAGSCLAFRQILSGRFWLVLLRRRTLPTVRLRRPTRVAAEAFGAAPERLCWRRTPLLRTATAHGAHPPVLRARCLPSVSSRRNVYVSTKLAPPLCPPSVPALPLPQLRSERFLLSHLRPARWPEARRVRSCTPAARQPHRRSLRRRRGTPATPHAPQSRASRAGLRLCRAAAAAAPWSRVCRKPRRQPPLCPISTG